MGSDKEFESIFENTGIATVIIRKDKTFLKVNKEFEAMSGCPRRSLELKRRWTEFFTPESLSYMEEYHRLRRIKPGLAPRNYEALFIDAKGKRKNVFMTVSMIPGTDRSVASIMDITPLKEARSQLDILREYQNSVINNVKDIIIIVNEQGMIVSWNKAIAEDTGLSERSVLMRNIFKDKLPAGISTVIDVLKRCLKTRSSEMIGGTITDHDGNERSFILSALVIKGENNTVKGTILIGRRISDNTSISCELKPGSSYLIENEPRENVFKVLGEYSYMRYQVMCLGRGDDPHMKECAKSFPITNKSGEEIIGAIRKAANEKTIIFLDRMDYLAITRGLEESLKLVYSIVDIAREKKSIFIARATNLDERQKSLLREELKAFPKINENIHIDKRKMEILKFVSYHNSIHQAVPFNSISKEFRLSRLSTKRWLDSLQKLGLIVVKKEGRVKNILLAESGKRFLAKN